MDAAIVGREQELSVASSFAAGLRDGPRALLFEGEAGFRVGALPRRGTRLSFTLSEPARVAFTALADVADQERASAHPAASPG
jgi:hypothetical protein